MLVLSRKVGQELVIGDNIRITINRVGGSRVTLGIEAPDDVRVVRGELEAVVKSFEQASAESTEAAESPSENVSVTGHVKVASEGATSQDVAEPARGLDPTRKAALAARVSASRVRRDVKTHMPNGRYGESQLKSATHGRSNGAAKRIPESSADVKTHPETIRFDLARPAELGMPNSALSK